MDAMDYWRLCDELSVVQAVLLILGVDPSDGSENNVLSWESYNRPQGFDAVLSALKGAMNAGSLPAKVGYRCEWVEYHADNGGTGDLVPESIPDWHLTVVQVNDLKKWLLTRGLKPIFFFPQGAEDRDYLDPNNPFYAPKLAAAVKAWETVTADQKLLSKKTPKQALEKWLREHATEYGLTKEDGTHNVQGIDQIAKVANWKPEGGASKTPVAIVADPPPPLKSPANNDLTSEDDLESEIPF